MTVDLDGRPYYPAIEQFALSNDAVPSPAVRSTPAQDIYMDIASTPSAGNGPVALAVYVEPLVMWLWIGGLVVVAGAVVSMVPSAAAAGPRRRRRPPGPDLEEEPRTRRPPAGGSEVGPPCDEARPPPYSALRHDRGGACSWPSSSGSSLQPSLRLTWAQQPAAR